MTGGRKRAFDKNEALQAAMEVFWQKGYSGASLADLTRGMGINKPSLYSAFGNKEELFVQATKLYIDKISNRHAGHLHEPGVPLRARLKHFMMSALSNQCASKHPRGCYIVLCQSELAAGDMPAKVRRLLTEAGDATQTLLANLFREDPEAKALGLDADAEGKALCLATTLRGTASMARAGKPLAELEYVIDHSLSGIGILDDSNTDSSKVNSPKTPP